MKKISKETKKGTSPKKKVLKRTFRGEILAPSLSSLEKRKSAIKSSEPIPVYEVRERREISDRGIGQLLSQARMQWQFGEWERLTQIDLLHIEHHPDRAELALLAGSGALQLGDRQKASTYLKTAKQWECDERLMMQLLLSGVHHSLGRYHLLKGNEEKGTIQIGLGGIGLGGDEMFIGEQRKRVEREKLQGISNKKTLINIGEQQCRKPKHSLIQVEGSEATVQMELHNSTLVDILAPGVSPRDFPQDINLPYEIKNIFQIVIVDGGVIPTNLGKISINNINAAKKTYPQANHILLNDKQLRAILSRFFITDVLKAYDKLVPYAFKADLARYCLLYLFGGLYIDLSIQLLKEYKIPTGIGITCFREPTVHSGSSCGVYNGIIYARPNRVEFHYAILKIIEHCRVKYYGVNPLAPTSPILFGQAIAVSNRLSECSCGQMELISSGEDIGKHKYVDINGDILAVRIKKEGGDASYINTVGINNYNKIWSNRTIYGEKYLKQWSFFENEIKNDIETHKNEDGIQVDEKFAGCAIFGPFVYLTPGKYIAEMAFIPGKMKGSGTIDIFSSNIGVISKSSFVCHRHNKLGIISIDFSLDSASDNIEVRLHCNFSFIGKYIYTRILES